MSFLKAFFDNLKVFNDYPFKHDFTKKQFKKWIFAKRKLNIQEFTDISLKDRENFSKEFTLTTLSIVKKQSSQKSKTEKFLFKTYDNHFIEAVLIDNLEGKFTLCLSSQVGCGYNCRFCATAQMSFKRNLTVSEIIEQYLLLDDICDFKIATLVFMGMGEPFLNTKNLFTAIDILTNDKPFGFGLSPTRLSISTSGVVLGIEKLIAKKIKVNLCISLHSAIQYTRDQIMPDFQKIPLEKLRVSLEHYNQVYRSPILIEYIMIKNINDDHKHLKALLQFVKGLKIKINLIAYNKIDNCEYQPSEKKAILFFKNELITRGYNVFQRYKKGDDIAAACGQLKVNFKNQNL